VQAGAGEADACTYAGSGGSLLLDGNSGGLAPRQVYGEGFVGPTAAMVTLLLPGSGEWGLPGAQEEEPPAVPVAIAAGKALGARSAYATTHAAGGGGAGAQLLFHMQGRVALPPDHETALQRCLLPTSPAPPAPGGRSSCALEDVAEAEGAGCGALAAWLRSSGGPAVVVALPLRGEGAASCDARAAAAGAAARLLHHLLQPAALPPWAQWLAAWRVTAVCPAAGLVVASQPHPPLPQQRRSEPLPAAGTASLLLARLRTIAAEPGSASVDAYRVLIAAGLAGDASRFVSPAEVLAAWAVWQSPASATDAAIAAQTTNATCGSGVGQPRLHLYQPGDSAWLLGRQLH